MGSICCKTVLSKEQEYDSIVSDPYEVRIYPAVVVAEIQCGDNALMALLQYLGAIGAPQNVKGM